MTLFDPHDPRPVHFVGIAGAGMSALAELIARRGITVTGCDASPNRNEALDALGIVVEPRHDPSHVAGAQARFDARHGHISLVTDDYGEGARRPHRLSALIGSALLRHLQIAETLARSRPR